MSTFTIGVPELTGHAFSSPRRVNDRIYLAADVYFDDDKSLLVDRGLSNSFLANPVAVFILKQLDGEVTVGDLVRRVQVRFGQSDEQSQDAVLGFLGYLDTRAMILRKHSFGLNLRRALSEVRGRLVGCAMSIERSISQLPAWGWAFLAGRLPRVPARRWAGNGVGLLGAVLRQGAATFIALALLCGLPLVAAALPNGQPEVVRDVVAVLVVLGVIHIGVLYGHELGHLTAARLLGLHPIVVTRRFSIAVVFRSTSPGRSKFIALAGPLAALTTGAMIALVGATATSLTGRSLLFGLPLGISHLVNLLPFAADGRLLWQRTQNSQI